MAKFTIPHRLRLFLPVSFIITGVVVFMTIWFVNKSLKNYNIQLEKNLLLEAETIKQMFEREADLKLETVVQNLNIAGAIFRSMPFEISDRSFNQEIENQETGLIHNAELKHWTLDGKDLALNNDFVDSLQSMINGTSTIFQRADSGFVRISTNVLREDGRRAEWTYIPYSSPVAKVVLTGERYVGRAVVVDDSYVTAYEPIFYNDSVVGMIYYGDKEKDLGELEQILNTLNIGQSGYPFVFDKNGFLIIHPKKKGEFWGESSLFEMVKENSEGVLHYEYEGRQKTMAYVFFDRFELYIAAGVFNDEETYELKRDAITGAVITAIISIFFLLGFLYYFTTERLYRFLSELQQSRKKLHSVSKALEESEERFRKLFDSTGDDIFVTDIDENIVEVNEAACESLGYDRDELLSMRITDIKSQKYKELVSDNRQIIFERGSHTFESEHVTKAGETLQVEFQSRLVNYGDEKLILSVVRNISQRREMERQILSAVIRGEERERQRFAREMHDGLGPLLSTIKLYVNELDTSLLSESERKELIKHSNELIDDAVNSTRTISNNLMPTVIHSYGLVKAVHAFCEKVNKTNQLNIQFETENIENRLDQNMELILFRVITELINNTIKHAEAKNVRILLKKYDENLSLDFTDDGVGFVVDEIIQSDNKGMGLKNIISRVKSINGDYNFSSRPGEGFNIHIEITL